MAGVLVTGFGIIPGPILAVDCTVYRKLIQPLLFRLDPETSHHLVLRLLRLIYLVPGSSALMRLLFKRRTPALPLTVFGCEFPNPVGLAAGLDKDACCAQAFSDMGFGWVELGTVTPEPQSGNPRPRIFRLPEVRGVINRMGFPGVGVQRFLRNLQKSSKRGLIGINIGKNAATPASRAIDDYLAAMRAVYPYADYITVNISSPNTSGLRDLQKAGALSELLAALKNEQIMQGKTRRHYVPLAVKIAPDLSDDEINDIADLVLEHKWDAVIATNTTVQRPGLGSLPLADEQGGLSGAPLRDLSTEVIRKLYNRLQGKVPIIGVGGVENASDAWDKFMAGADLIQLYSSFIYQGPAVVRRIVRGLERRMRTTGETDFATAIASARRGIRLMR